MEALAFGFLAAILQALGYLAYSFKVLREDIVPNPASWIMFAYGTTLLVVVEWDRGASFPLLILPIVCALLSVGIAWYCLHKVRRAWWPEHPLERFSFGLDVFLTLAYVATWALITQGFIGESDKDSAEILILICWNVGIFTAFFHFCDKSITIPPPSMPRLGYSGPSHTQYCLLLPLRKKVAQTNFFCTPLSTLVYMGL